jgi:hypothetical protein
MYEYICNIFVFSKNTFADTLACGLASGLKYAHELFVSMYTGRSEIEHRLSVFCYHSYAFWLISSVLGYSELNYNILHYSFPTES